MLSANGKGIRMSRVLIPEMEKKKVIQLYTC